MRAVPRRSRRSLRTAAASTGRNERNRIDGGRPPALIAAADPDPIIGQPGVDQLAAHPDGAECRFASERACRVPPARRMLSAARRERCSNIRSAERERFEQLAKTHRSLKLRARPALPQGPRACLEGLDPDREPAAHGMMPRSPSSTRSAPSRRARAAVGSSALSRATASASASHSRRVGLARRPAPQRHIESRRGARFCGRALQLRRAQQRAESLERHAAPRAAVSRSSAARTGA